jgi:Ca2+-binding EF-hand superfamily protein
MGCCCSKGGVEDAEAREARRERERERRRATGADDEDEDDAVSSSRARVQAWQMEADEAEEEDDAHPEPDGLVGGLDEERAGKWVSKSARVAMARAFKEALHSGKYRFERDKENALSARRLGENHPQCRGNPLAGRILASFSEKRDGGLRAKDWIAACAVLHPDGSYPNKARAGFHAYDFDADGVVNEKDLIATLRLILGDGVSERQVIHIVDQLKKKFDENNDGVLEEKEFRALLSKDDIAQRFTMDLYGKFM